MARATTLSTSKAETWALLRPFRVLSDPPPLKCCQLYEGPCCNSSNLVVTCSEERDERCDARAASLSGKERDQPVVQLDLEMKRKEILKRLSSQIGRSKRGNLGQLGGHEAGLFHR